MKKLIHTILLLSLFGGGLFAQQPPKIKRQVIGSYGTQHLKANVGSTTVCLAATVGQPPSAGTISDGGNILRQGFQQPQPNNCAIAISFVANKIMQQGCGTYYAFEYTGDLPPGIEISWNFGPNALPMLADGAVPQLIAFSQDGAQQVTVTVSDGQCQNSASQIVDSDGNSFAAQAQKQDAFCFGDKGAIDLTVLGGTAPFAFKWSNDKTTEDLNGLTPGDYTYTVTDINGCNTTGSETIEGATKPLSLTAKVSDEICKDTHDGKIELTLANAAQPATYEWNDGATGAERDSLTKGMYSVKITDANGCQTDSVFNIRTFCELSEEDFIPDVFSPNGDGVNDVWAVEMIDLFPNHSVSLFNRWGNLIWEAKGNFAGWDGRNSKGEDMPIGAYFYVIKLNNPEDKIFKGTITLIR